MANEGLEMNSRTKTCYVILVVTIRSQANHSPRGFSLYVEHRKEGKHDFHDGFPLEVLWQILEEGRKSIEVVMANQPTPRLKYPPFE